MKKYVQLVQDRRSGKFRITSVRQHTYLMEALSGPAHEQYSDPDSCVFGIRTAIPSNGNIVITQSLISFLVSPCAC